MDYEGYIPPIFDTSEVTVNIENNKSAKVELWDTAGEEQRGSQWRSLGYPQTDLFFICYSVVVSDEPLTLQRIEFFTQEIKGFFFEFFFLQFLILRIKIIDDYHMVEKLFYSFIIIIIS